MLTKSIVTAVVAGGLAFGIAVPAQAAQAECTVNSVLVSAAVAEQPAVYGDAPLITPAQEAWIESVLVTPAVPEMSHVVHHDAVYEPRTVVTQPFVAAVPAVDEVSHVVHHEAVVEVVHHDAVTEVVHHEAVTHTEYTRYSWTGGKRGPGEGNTPATSPRDWNADKKKYDGSKTGVVLQQGNGNGSYFYWGERQVVDKKAWDETVVVTEAWDEKVVVSEAWDEKVIDVEARPATPAQEEISHIEYDLVSEAWDETIVDAEAQDAVYIDVEHPAEAAVYGEPALLSPAVPAQDAVFEDVEECVASEGPTGVVAPAELPLAGEGDNRAVAASAPAELALTGGGINPIVPIGAGALIVGGLVALMGRRRTRVERND